MPQLTRAGCMGPLAQPLIVEREPPFSESMGLFVQFDPGVWTDITEDVLVEHGIRIRYGIDGNGPADVVASTGECLFSLNNSETNSGGLEGYYSPAHVNKRTGWQVNLPLKVEYGYAGITYTKFRGKIGSVSPDAGQYGSRQAHVVGYDHMRDLMRADVREVETQVNQTDATLIQLVYDSVPAAGRPPAANIDSGLETVPYAFDDLGEGTKTASVIHDICVSGQSIAFCAGNGTFTWRNRETRAAVSSAYGFESELRGLDVTASSDLAYNKVRITIPNKTVGAAPVILWEATGAIEPIFPGETKEIWGNYRDPNDVTRAIGGYDVITPVAATDYAGNALPNGGGVDLTADLDVTMEAFASSVKLTIENTGGQDIYFVNGAGQTVLQVRGTPVYIDADRVFEAVADDGESPIDLMMPYQASGFVAQALAEYILAHYNQVTQQFESVEFEATREPSLLLQALAREPGDCITITESVTGTDAADVVIQAVEIDIRRKRDTGNFTIFCRWGIALALDPNAPPPPAAPDDDGDLVVTYTGPVTGSHNLSTDGELVLTVGGSYGFAFSRLGLSVRVKGAGGGAGGNGPFFDEDDVLWGGGGGGSGALHLTGVVVPITQTTYTGSVGAKGGGGNIANHATAGGDTMFRKGGSGTIHLQLTGGDPSDFTDSTSHGIGGDATVPASGGVDGSDGGAPDDVTAGDNPTGMAGGGAGGSGMAGGGPGGSGGSGGTQTGGAGGAVGLGGSYAAPVDIFAANPGGGDPTIDTGFGGGGGGGAGGGVLLGGVYVGGGGGGAGGSISGTGGGDGGAGVLVMALEP